MGNVDNLTKIMPAGVIKANVWFVPRNPWLKGSSAFLRKQEKVSFSGYPAFFTQPEALNSLARLLAAT
jgi:hypothetical protein